MSSFLQRNLDPTLDGSRLFSSIASRHAARERLHWLSAETLERGEERKVSRKQIRVQLENFQGRLGKAGFLSSSQRRVFLISSILFTVALSVVCILLTRSYGIGVQLLVFLVSLYGASLLILLYLRRAEKHFNQQLLSELPLVLESMILLVESGVGVLPALEQVTKSSQFLPSRSPAKQTLLAVYQLSEGGLPFSQALGEVAKVVTQPVLRHVLLHLDVSGVQGGELAPALRALAHHTHIEWRLAVEHRVSQLENYVVFPVFLAVIGLMFLTAAVPLVPVLEFMDSIDSSKSESLLNNASPEGQNNA